MADVIPFPSTVKALGFAFPAAVLAAGLAVAEQVGIAPGQVDALMEDVRPFAIYFLSHLGSDDEHDQRVGEFGLRRLLSAMEARA